MNHRPQTCAVVRLDTIRIYIYLGMYWGLTDHRVSRLIVGDARIKFALLWQSCRTVNCPVPPSTSALPQPMPPLPPTLPTICGRRWRWRGAARRVIGEM